MKVFYADAFTIPLPPGHRFPMPKYRMLRELLLTRTALPLDYVEAPPASRDDLLRAHAPNYVDGMLDGSLPPRQMKDIGFPWSPALVQRSLHSVGATIAAVGAATSDGIAASLAGGTHHASRDGGGGFCVFNDIAVAAARYRADRAGTRVLIVDCDVHQGDGTAAIFADEADVFTFSIHSSRNYPLRKAVSDLDIALPDDTTDATYLALLKSGLEMAWRASRPTLCIFQAGVDVYAGDRLGRLALSADAVGARDRLVLEYAERHAVPLALVMGGGYAPDIRETVALHAQTIAIAAGRRAP